ncbi:MAG: VWA domain-containing protein [Rikenellaceae bacterium]|jgi:hypothetical protein|nr:VWA domain-containing protein [Rikenellaceae bacterium]
MTRNDPSRTPRVTRNRPSVFVFLIDQSGSMEEKITFNDETLSKSAAVASIVNGLLGEILHRCKREEGYRHYFDVAVFGYGGNEVRSLLPGAEEHGGFLTPAELAAAPVETVRYFRERVLTDGRRLTSVAEQKAWITPRHIGKTPMYAALAKAHDTVHEWVRDHTDQCGFPPIVINISDGEATDAGEEELAVLAERIRGLSTDCGPVMLVNIHLSPGSDELGVMFPAEGDLPDKPYARLLFRLSSAVPAIFYGEVAAITGRREFGQSRLVSYNSTMTDLIGMLSIGTVSINLLD